MKTSVRPTVLCFALGLAAIAGSALARESAGLLAHGVLNGSSSGGSSDTFQGAHTATVELNGVVSTGQVTSIDVDYTSPIDGPVHLVFPNPASPSPSNCGNRTWTAFTDPRSPLGLLTIQLTETTAARDCFGHPEGFWSVAISDNSDPDVPNTFDLSGSPIRD